jgi:prolyl 4-hydroxylase
MIQIKRNNLQSQNSNPNFIGSWIINPSHICDKIISYFENNIHLHKNGRTGSGFDQSIKNSTDMSIAPREINLPGNEIFIEYFKLLFNCHNDYLLQWPFIRDFAGDLQIGKFNIQRYRAGQHFQQVHTERFSLGTLHRVLAWMTYLNDVDDGGSTCFNHYDLDVQPQKGLTLIWPAEWTHAHQGKVLNSGEKYIITGWMDLYK